MGVIEIAERLRSLASDPEHRHAIVHDQHMLPTLTVFLENSVDTPAVRRTTLDTLEYLAMHAPNRLAMRSEPGLTAALLSVAEKADSGVCARLARSILAAVAETHPSVAAAMNSDPFETPCKERVELPAALVAQANAAKLRDASVVDYTFFVKGLHGEAQRDAVEQNLLTVVGIVSFWFDIYQQKAEVRARVDQATIVDAIAKAGFTAVEWRGEGSPHKLDTENKPATTAAKSASSSSSSSSASSNSKDADYLDEKENVQHSYGSGGWLGTLAIFGAPAPAKKKGGKKEKDAGLLGALASWW